MLAYVALVWNVLDPATNAAAGELVERLERAMPHWLTTLGCAGLHIRHHIERGPNIDEVYLLTRQRGVVFGKLFTRRYVDGGDSSSSIPAAVVLDDRVSDQIVATNGRHLISGYWGQYVAFIVRPALRESWILRDPSGGMPCHWMQVRGVSVYFVRMADYDALGPFSYTINLHYLRGLLVCNSACVRETGLEQIETVPPGECIRHHGDRRTSVFVWNPLKIAATDVIEDFDEAVRLTRHTVRACVHAWASCFEGVLLYLSGGVDSSIVLACLADAPTHPRVICLTEYSDGPSSDERWAARTAARHAGFELVEVERNVNVDVRHLLEFPRSPYPFPFEGPTSARLRNRVARTYDLDSVFTGTGGDEVFYRFGPVPGAADYFWLHGARPHGFSIAYEEAVATGDSFCRVLRESLMYKFGGRVAHPSRVMGAVGCRSLLKADVVFDALNNRSHWHPLFVDAACGVPPAKVLHAYSMTALTTRGYTPGLVRPATVSAVPLLSQPVIELGLRTPSYLLSHKGRDRAVARQAFKEDLPAGVLLRKTKGMMELHMQRVIARNAGLVSGLLAEGVLAQLGFLDAAPITKLAASGFKSSSGGTSEVFDYLWIEAWIRAARYSHDVLLPETVGLSPK